MDKALVCYFSATGKTKKVATQIAQYMNAEIYEITPVIPYSEKDLNWKNPFSRCNKEKLGKAKVEIAWNIASFDDYNTIFIGFPIWYYTIPPIVAEFLKQYNFSGKSVALFCTSGGTTIDKAAATVKNMISPNALLIDTHTFKSISDIQVKEWVNNFLVREKDE